MQLSSHASPVARFREHHCNHKFMSIAGITLCMHSRWHVISTSRRWINTYQSNDIHNWDILTSLLICGFSQWALFVRHVGLVCQDLPGRFLADDTRFESIANFLTTSAPEPMPFFNISSQRDLSTTTDHLSIEIAVYFGSPDHWGHRTRAAVTLDNMAEDAIAASASLRQFLTGLFVTAAQLLWVDCQCYGTHWRGIPSYSDSVSRRNSGLKFHVATRVSVMSFFHGTRVSVGRDEGTAVYRW